MATRSLGFLGMSDPITVKSLSEVCNKVMKLLASSMPDS